MKKFSNWLKNRFSDKKTINHHQNPSRRSSMNMSLKESWTKLMHSTHKKLSEGASEFTRAMRSRGGSNSKISGREHEKGHHQANHKNNSKK